MTEKSFSTKETHRWMSTGKIITALGMTATVLAGCTGGVLGKESINTDPSKGLAWDAESQTFSFCYNDGMISGEVEIPFSASPEGQMTERGLVINSHEGNVCEGKDNVEGIPSNGDICVELPEDTVLNTEDWEFEPNINPDKPITVTLDFFDYGTENNDTSFNFLSNWVYTSAGSLTCEEKEEVENHVREYYSEKGIYYSDSE